MCELGWYYLWCEMYIYQAVQYKLRYLNLIIFSQHFTVLPERRNLAVTHSWRLARLDAFLHTYQDFEVDTLNAL